MTGVEPAAFRLGGGPSILLRYMDLYKIFSVGRLLQQALRRLVVYSLRHGRLSMSFCLLKYAGMKADFYICGYDKNKLRRIKVILLKFHLDNIGEIL